MCVILVLYEIIDLNVVVLLHTSPGLDRHCSYTYPVFLAYAVMSENVKPLVGVKTGLRPIVSFSTRLYFMRLRLNSFVLM